LDLAASIPSVGKLTPRFYGLFQVEAPIGFVGTPPVAPVQLLVIKLGRFDGGG